jgi:hypothetical protein
VNTTAFFVVLWTVSGNGDVCGLHHLGLTVSGVVTGTFYLLMRDESHNLRYIDYRVGHLQRIRCGGWTQTVAILLPLVTIDHICGMSMLMQQLMTQMHDHPNDPQGEERQNEALGMCVYCPTSPAEQWCSRHFACMSCVTRN